MFADPDTLKVMHGADSDVLWLQRDFGLFPVGLLDTGQAARVLELPGFGLAHLLQQYCDFKARTTLSWPCQPMLCWLTTRCFSQ